MIALDFGFIYKGAEQMRESNRKDKRKNEQEVFFGKEKK